MKTRTAAGTPRSAGITLTEILISILILGVGLVSLATLFPIGLCGLREAQRQTRSAYLFQSATADVSARGLFNANSFLYADLLNNGGACPTGTSRRPSAASTRSLKIRPRTPTPAAIPCAARPPTASRSLMTRSVLPDALSTSTRSMGPRLRPGSPRALASCRATNRTTCPPVPMACSA